MRRLGWSILLMTLTGGALLTATLLQSTTAHRRSDLQSMGFGLPFPWLRQDLTGVNQPLPFRPHPRPPTDFPTSISFELLAVDFLAVMIVLMLATALYKRVTFTRATAKLA